MRYLKLLRKEWILAFDLVRGRKHDRWVVTAYRNGVKHGVTNGGWECLDHALQYAESQFHDLLLWEKYE